MPVEPPEIDVPLEALRESLRTMMPFDPEGRWVGEVDSMMKADGRLGRLLYESVLNHVLRRVVTAGLYLDRNTESGAEHVEAVRSFLENHTGIPVNDRELILALVLMCTAAAGLRVPNGRKRDLLADARDQGLRCYICRNPLVWDDEGSWRYRMIEHLWPNALGGGNQVRNLRVSCKACSDRKKDYIDGSDFHYEEICLTTDPSHTSFLYNFRTEYRVAVALYNGLECKGQRSDEPCEDGPLQFARRDPTDTWHFLNIETYCPRHRPTDTYPTEMP